MDKLIRGIAKDGMIRVMAADTRDLVGEASRIHGCTPTAAAALGRMLTAGSLMGSMLKSEKDALTLQINGGGEAQGVVVTAHNDASVKGYIGNSKVHLPQNDKGKLDVGGAIGRDGNLMVIRDMGLKEPYVGQVPIYSGEIAEDIAYYFTASEQVPTAVALGVLVDVDYTIKAAGGFIIQLMPEADELLADLITYRLEEVPPITKLLSDGKTIEEITEYIFEGMDLKLTEEVIPEYKCDCSREKVEGVLLSIGKKDLVELYEDNKEEELICHFCNTKYSFSHEDIGRLIEESTKKEQ
ncbi:Hsp33 family molecular chaperone HslO [Alloiococcus sp. CFN-8]|uniref:Hsp33 family molecular chaperone HslO n=1 Tax=Alloiococcus sp. CFN-8 TaxID=3416081 RepID=UPI003CF0E158